MALSLVMGSSGSGKTYRFYQELIDKALNDEQAPLLLIVPEQFTLQTQQDLLQFHPRNGIMNIEVLSFQRLAYRIYDDLALADRSLLKDTGKSMAIRKLVEDSKERYPLIYPNIKRKGYIKELKDLITEFYQYHFNEEAFEKIQSGVQSPLLKGKMKDSQMLFEDFKAFLSDQYLTPESMLDLLMDGVEHNEWLKEASIYLDGFYGFTPIQYGIISQLLKKAKEVHIAVTMDAGEQLNDLQDNSELFYESKKMVQWLLRIVEEEGISLNEMVKFSDPLPYRFRMSEEIAHLEKNLFRYPYKVYDPKPRDIKMCCATNMRQEVGYVADTIMKLVMSEGYRYKEISVVTGDLSGYENQIKQVFELYGIPFFMDQKKTIMNHPLVELLLAALEIINKDFSYDSVLRYIKTGLISLNQDDVDLIENYVLAYGIRGLKSWEMTWEKAYPQFGMEQDSEFARNIQSTMNAAKNHFLAPLIILKKEVKFKESTVADITKGLYNFVRTLELQEKIADFEGRFEREGKLLYQKEYAQIYNIIVDVLDQMTEIIGNQAIILKEYIGLLQAGLEECEMGLVPPGLDQVVIGDLERTRLKETKALFVIGFNEGKVPKVVEQANIITDFERIQLKELGISLAPDNKENIFKEQFSLYMGLLKVNQKLFLSYSKSNVQGKSMRPSLLFFSIKKMFSKMKVIDLDEIYGRKCVINRPKPTFDKMINEMISMDDWDKSSRINEMYKWFFHQKQWVNLALSIHNGLSFKNEEPILSQETVEALYGKNLKNSVSRLEAFAKCPFAHFVDYGLQLNERLDYSVKMPDIGILFHRAIDLCSRKIEASALNWNTLNTSSLNLLVEESVIEAVGAEQRGIYSASARNTYLVKRLTRITKRAMWAISQQISRGEFRPMNYEYAFDADRDCVKSLSIDFEEERTMHLSGRIDRVDAYQGDEALYLSVVDYKSGNQSFDLVALYYGLQLQLLVYLNAATELKKNSITDGEIKVIPAGIFYFHIDDPIIKDVSDRSSKAIEDMILKELRLKGLVLDQQEIIKKMDPDIEKTSDIIPVSITKQGDISKNSSVASIEQFEELQRFVDFKMKELGTSIVGGELSVKPYKRKTETGCDYCDYLSICRFEQGVQGNSYRVLKDFSKHELWDKISEELSKY